MAVFVTRLLLCAFSTLLLAQGQNQCSHGSVCAGGPSCEIESVLYCCPDAFMTLRWDYGNATPCSFQSDKGTGFLCSGTGDQGNTSSTTPPSSTSVFRSTTSVISGQSQCSHGPGCANYSNCEIGSVYYCCPDAYMNLTHDYGNVTSCSCQNGKGTGYVCSGTGDQDNTSSTAPPSSTTTSVFSSQCSYGRPCAHGHFCEIGSVHYCCPGAYMNLTHEYDNVTSCYCRSDKGIGYVCSGSFDISDHRSTSPRTTGGPGNSGDCTSASGLTCTLISAVAIVLVSRWILQE